jgi:hypothetical protein
LLAQQHSGLSQAAFCRRNDLALSTFQYWRRRLRDESAQAETESDAPQAPEFVELLATTTGSAPVHTGRFELTFPSGVHLTVPTGVEGRALAEILWALEATGVC